MCDEMKTGICESCGNECTAVVRDFGIGSYEFWGYRSVHHDYHAVSPCCEADVVDGGEKIVRKSIHVARKDHGDGKIKKGDKYSLIVRRHWRKDGPHWITSEKRKIAT